MPIISHETIADDAQADGARYIQYRFTFDSIRFRLNTADYDSSFRKVAAAFDDATDRAAMTSIIEVGEDQRIASLLQADVEAGTDITADWLSFSEARQQQYARSLARWLLQIRADENLPFIVISLGPWIDYLNAQTGAGLRWENAAALATWLDITTTQLQKMNQKQKLIREVQDPCLSAETAIDDADSQSEIIE